MVLTGVVNLRPGCTALKCVFLKGLNAKQRRDHYFTKDFIKLKQMPSWKEMAKSARVKPPEEAVYPKDNHLNEKISLFRGDITKLEVDAVVNAGGRAFCWGKMFPESNPSHLWAGVDLVRLNVL
ncbi:UNVERIFIED_CONTAM: O-acetyl-ADP-ribose deacetylase macrod1 [Gekko kuhli]